MFNLNPKSRICQIHNNLYYICCEESSVKLPFMQKYTPKKSLFLLLYVLGMSISLFSNPASAQLSGTFSTSQLYCQANANFIALYPRLGQSPLTFSIQGPVNQNNASGYFSNLPNGTYNGTITDALNNTFNISNIQVINNVSNANFITQDTSICAGTSMQITAQGGNGIYNWSSLPNDHTIQFINDSTATISPSATTTYTLSGGGNTNLIYNHSFQLGNTGFFSNYTLVNQITNPVGQQGIAGVSTNPNFFFNPFASCADQDGNSAMLVVDGATAPVPISILWEQAVPVQPNTNYTFSFWATSVVSVNPAQLQSRINNVLVNTTVLGSSVCNWQQITMTWNSGASNIAVINIRDLNIQANGNDFAIDNLFFYETNGVCADSLTITVENSIPINVTPTAEVCLGAYVSITPSNGTNLQWTYPNGSISNSNTLNLNNISNQNAGIYTVSSNNPNSCFTPAQFTLTILPSPDVTTQVGQISCNGSNDGFVTTNVAGSGTFNYLWSNGATSPNLNNLSPGIYTLIVEGQNGCESQLQINISEPAPLVINLNQNQPDCNQSNGSANVVVSGGTSNYQISWSNGQSGANANNLAAGNYTVVVVDANNCSTTQTFVISPVDGPVVSVDFSETLLCFGDQNGYIDFTVNGGTPGYTYIWQPNVSSTQNAANLGSGTYNIQIIDGSNCVQDFSILIEQPEQITANASLTNPNCGQNNGNIQIEAFGGVGALSYNWSPNVSTSAVGNNLAAGNYTVSINDENGCNIQITENLIPVGVIPLSVSPSSAVIEPNQSVQLNANIGAGITNYTVSWSPPDGLSCTDCLNPIASPSESTTYQITISTPDGCQRTVSVSVSVELPCKGVAIPTIFSPNGDGLNDEICIQNQHCVETFELAIYNRWGELVFYTNNPNECWDGSFRGQPAQIGVYAYKVFANATGLFLEESGNISLVR